MPGLENILTKKKTVPVKFNILHRKPASWAQCEKILQETITFTDKGKSTRYSDLEDTLAKIKERKTLI